MILEIIIDYLADKLTIPVAAELYADAPEEIVVVNRAGSERQNRLDTIQLIATSYACSMADAARLNESVKSALDDLTDLDEVSGSYLVTDYQAPDTSTRKYRYQAVYNVNHY